MSVRICEVKTRNIGAADPTLSSKLRRICLRAFQRQGVKDFNFASNRIAETVVLAVSVPLKYVGEEEEEEERGGR